MDGSLIERAQAGDRQALEQLLEEIAPQVRRFGMRMCRHEADADDVLQDTLLSVSKHLDQFAGRASLSSWVFSLARSACARKRRGLKNQPHQSTDTLGSVPAEVASPEAAAAGQELRTAVAEALDDLSEEHREVVLLRDMEGLTAPEVAESLGLSVPAVKSRLHRARAGLREALQATLERDVPAPSPGCPDVVAALSRKLEGDLSPADCAAMEAHLAECPACEGACATLRAALGACRQETAREVPEEVRARIHDAVERLLETTTQG